MNDDYHYLSVTSLEATAPSRLPGYLEHIRSAGIPVLSDGVPVAYKLTKEQMLEVKTLFNPADAEGIARQQRKLLEYQQLQKVLKLRSSEISSWVNQVLDPEVPCAFAGCAELKRALDAELVSLGAACTNCQVNRVEARFTNIIHKLWADHDHPDTPPPLAAVLAAIPDPDHVVVHDRASGASDPDAAPDWVPQSKP